MQPIAEKLSDEMRKKEYKYCVCEKKVVPLQRENYVEIDKVKIYT